MQKQSEASRLPVQKPGFFEPSMACDDLEKRADRKLEVLNTVA